jgi:hypothetical protein
LHTSDKYITKECGFLDKIKPGDEVMADRGFVIRDLLLTRKATLKIPPFTTKCKWGKGKRGLLFYSIPYASYFLTSGFKRSQKNAHTFTI